MERHLQILFNKILNGWDQSFEIFFVVMNNNKVVRISDVSFYLQRMLCKNIQFIEIHIREKLGGQVPDRQTEYMKTSSPSKYYLFPSKYLRGNT